MVKQIKKILYTTDLSKSSIAVFEQTISLAVQTGAAVILLHVIEDGSTSSHNRTVHLVSKEAYEEIRNQSRDMVKNVLIGKQRTIPFIQEALQELCEKTTEKICRFDTPVTIDDIDVQYGNAADIIVRTAEITGCDLIAMGYHKRGSILKALMGGSGSKSILQQSKTPIYLVPIDD